jgi:hypothetical protein
LIGASHRRPHRPARRTNIAPQIGKLCATPFGIDIVGITEFIALAGALVGGVAARQRKAELERLNEQLRKVRWALCLGGLAEAVVVICVR